ncbi:response regulator aspartate phosphatase [Shouchella lehensis G1]|uniref:Response regulator aspartate phosphatase n=1 Tax=Shouchella lehensis G1 TaxID=1246626 RepID=A0A060LT68_9BACI|nr:Rap family tetratricopeptide repeat protein [Shouchella oshimensis]AIC94441.1 response regulator aspartate phosphatase [Shouchella lehensis G1]
MSLLHNKIPSSEVGAKIVEWYSCILSNSYKEATLLKNEVQQMIKSMQEDDKILAYYSLVEYRHNNILDKSSKTEPLEDQFKFVESELDHYLKYLYYFVSGQDEFNKQKYRTAVKMFRKAERLLENVKDETEEADFLGYMGYAYYRIDQYLFALSYLEQAETAFRRLGSVYNAVNNKQVAGAIYVELKQYEKGEQILQECLEESESSTMTGIILKAIGLSKFTQSKYESAVYYFQKALEIEEINNSYYGMKALTELSHAQFKLEKIEEARNTFKKAKASAQFYESFEFKARCKFIEGLYILDNQNMVDESINELIEEGLLFEVCELAEELIEIYEKKGDNENVIKYYKIAYSAKLKPEMIGDGQE